MNDNPNIQESESQCKRILAYLLNGSRITSLEALRLFGCMRLASRISDLRKSHPEIKFKATRVETTTGGKSSVSCPLKPSDSAPLC